MFVSLQRWLPLAALSLVALVVRVSYVVWVAPDELGLDAIWYQLQAGTIAAGVGYVDPVPYYGGGETLATAGFPPLWPAILAVVDAAGLDTQDHFQVVGAVVGTVTVPLTAMVGSAVAGRRVGLVAAALVALSPLLVAADGSLMAESPYVALLMGALLAGYRTVERPSRGRVVLLGALIGLAALARSDALLVAPFLVGAVAWRVGGASRRRQVGTAALALAVTGAVLLPWTVRTSVQMGAPVLLSTNSGSLLEGANCPSTYGGRLIGGWDHRCLVETRRPGTPEVRWAAAGRSAGVRHAVDHPERLPIVAGARVLRGWGLWHPVRQVDDLEVVESRRRGWQLAGWAYGMAALALAVPGARLLRRRQADIAPLVALAAGTTLVLAVSWGNQRFRLAADPVVAVAAATALVTGAARARTWLRPASRTAAPPAVTVPAGR